MSCNRALILAAGRGSRLGTMTQERPKCLVRLAGRRLLDWQLAALRQAGVLEIALVTGYLADRLAFPGLSSFYNSKWDVASIVYSLLAADEWLEDGPSFIAYGDIVYHSDWVSLLESSPGNIVIAYDRLWRQLWEERFEHPEQDAESFIERNGILEEIGQRITSLESAQGQYVGLLKFTPAGWRQIRSFLSDLPAWEIERLDITALLTKLLHAGVEVRAVGITGKWCEVDTVDDLLLYERHAASLQRWSHDWR